MAMSFLEFEQPIAELEAKIEELKFLGDGKSAQHYRRNQKAYRIKVKHLRIPYSPT